MTEMSDETKAALTEIALEDGYTEEQVQEMIETGNLIFGDLI